MSSSVLTDSLLQGCRERAAGYDRDNRFCQEDFDALKAAGYLKMALPKEFGGAGMTLAEVARETRHLAMYAPATALCINMHNYWVGNVADLFRGGDRSLEWLLRDAAAGEVFAAGHAEHGNDVPGLLSTTKAERVDGGYKLTGRKAFGSLSPVWTRLGGHAMDASDPAAPKIVHFFMPRDTKGYSIKDTWDVMGMRATRSDDTVLEGAFVPDKYIGRVVPAGAAGADMFVIGFFTWALVNFANIYYAIGLRTREVLIEQLKTKTSHGALAADDLPPRNPARHRRDHHGSRDHGPACRSDRERLVRGPHRPGLVPAHRRLQAPHGGGRVPHRRSRARSVGRLRDVQEERVGTAVPRLPRRQVPPGQPAAVARNRREDLARDQPGRTAAVGLDRPLVSNCFPRASRSPIFLRREFGERVDADG